MPKKAAVNFIDVDVPEVKKLSAREIKAIRLRGEVSQNVFAILLNASLATVRRWERGETKPRGASLRLLNVVENRGVKILYGTAGDSKI